MVWKEVLTRKEEGKEMKWRNTLREAISVRRIQENGLPKYIMVHNEVGRADENRSWDSCKNMYHRNAPAEDRKQKPVLS